jgi:hypothetical protein
MHNHPGPSVDCTQMVAAAAACEHMLGVPWMCLGVPGAGPIWLL